MTVGENIKRIRKEKKLTQKKLGELCHPKISESTIRKYELGILNPKIETIDKIAYALDVPIFEIKEDTTREQNENSLLFKQVDRMVSAKEGIVAILADLYGKVEEKSVEAKDGGECFYFLVGEEKEQFILYDKDIDTLYESTKASIPFLVNSLKDTRTEKEIIDEYWKQVDDTRQEKAVEQIDMLTKIPEYQKDID